MLTTEQQVTLAAAVNADPAFAGLPHNSDGAFAIADAMNLQASPSWIAWKTNVSVDEIMRNGMDWARVDNLSVGKARIWDWLGRLGSFDSSKPNIRVGIDSAWVGTSADLAVRAAIYVHCKRTATRIEKLLSTGTGTDAVPATMGYEGAVNYNDVQLAMGW